MMRFTIRDLLWLTVVIVTGIVWFLAAHKSALLEARLQSAERQVWDLKARNDAVASENKTNFATFEALATALKRVELSEEQRDSIRGLFTEELKR
jgi:hypothetical protein